MSADIFMASKPSARTRSLVSLVMQQPHREVARVGIDAQARLWAAVVTVWFQNLPEPTEATSRMLRALNKHRGNLALNPDDFPFAGEWIARVRDEVMCQWQGSLRNAVLAWTVVGVWTAAHDATKRVVWIELAQCLQPLAEALEQEGEWEVSEAAGMCAAGAKRIAEEVWG